jgi:hypothetical protein
MLNKKERRLTVEILKRTLANDAGRGFLEKRFSKESLRTAAGLLEEMGAQIRQHHREKQEPS